MPSKRARNTRKGNAPRPDTEHNHSNQIAPPRPASWSFLGVSAEIWLVWLGLVIGLFYGWFYNRSGGTGGSSQPPVEVDIRDPNIVSPWHVVELPGKGKGAIASRDIARGELLLREKPLFIVPTSINESPTEYIWNRVQNLTEAQRQAFFDLSFVGLPQNKNPEVDKEHLSLAIFETNAAAAGSGVGLFPRMARLNHGCSSAFNVVYSFREDEGVLLIHAMKPIARGSEVLTTYTDTKRPRSQRRDYLLQHYGFHCTCSVCSLPDKGSEASDRRLSTMTQYYGELKRWATGEVSGVDAINFVRSIWRLGDEEGYHSERGRLAADAVWVAAAYGDLEAVREWGLLSIKWYAYELGADSPFMAEIEAALARPESHRAWNMRPRMKVGNPEGIS